MVTGADYVYRALHLRRTSARARASGNGGSPQVSRVRSTDRRVARVRVGIQVGVVAVGDELLLRSPTPTRLTSVRPSPRPADASCWAWIVGDDVDDIAAAVRTAAARVDLVVVTGGLGPDLRRRHRGRSAAAADGLR
jgi:phosphoglycolate phosphatase-like HAD superfamily hydrolase